MTQHSWVAADEGVYVLLARSDCAPAQLYAEERGEHWREVARVVRVPRVGWVRHVVGLPLSAASRSLARAKRQAAQEAGL